MNRRAVIVGGVATALVGGTVASHATMGSPEEYARAIARQRAPLAPAGGVLDVIRFATLAANGHNSQPWRFQIEPRSIRILPDMLRRTPVVDPDDHHLYVSLGCAAENLSLAAAAAGIPGEFRFETEGEGAVVFEHDVAGISRASMLCDAIPHRQSCRAEFDGRVVSAGDLVSLAHAAKEPGVDVAFITDRRGIDRVKDLVIEGNSVQMADPAFVGELRSWMRFNPRAALTHCDGLYSAASANPTLPTWLGTPMMDLVFTADAENQKYSRQLTSSSGVVIFSGGGENPAHWVAVGRACQRFALQATVLGLKTAFINQPVEVVALRAALASLAGMSGRRPDIAMRFGYGPTLPMSPRRPVDMVIAA